MTQTHAPMSQRIRWANRWHAWRATRGEGARAFVSSPEPRTLGAFARGKQLVAGNFLFAGHLVQSPAASIWDVTPPSAQFEAVAQGFGWLDDLAALGDREARLKAQAWTLDWITRFGGGKGPGWEPDLAGRRLIRWINHALMILNGAEEEESRAFYRSLGHQTVFLERRWKHASNGLPRFEALTGLIYAGLALEGMAGAADGAVKALARNCEREIDEQGGLPSRNPEELLEVFTLINWATMALSEVGREVPKELKEAQERIAPTLRALRHSDGGLARFHGGGRGVEGRLDQALAASGVRIPPGTGLAMGYGRLSSGRTSIIMDASAPPIGAASYAAHASTLAMEITSGRRPLIVSCGSGEHFGEDWGKAGRATPSHSVLHLSGFSSSHLSDPVPTTMGPRAQLTDPPGEVDHRLVGDMHMSGVVMGHSAYAPSHGLAYVRRIELTTDGRKITGEETLAAMSEAEQYAFDRARAREGAGVPFDIRFHLHPDVDATLDMGGTAVSMALRSGEIWVLQFQGQVDLRLNPSVYLEKTRLKPRAAKQVVLSGRAIEYATRIRWTLAKAKDTPIGVRDLERDEADELPD